MADDQSRSQRLQELAFVFLRLGTIAIGGPPAHLAMMRREFVQRRGWMTEEEFLDRLGAANLIPGPSSTEVTIFIGFLRVGWPGLFVAGAAFTLPAVIIVTFVAWLYVRFGSLPQVNGLFYLVKPVVIVLIIQSVWKLGRAAAHDAFLIMLGIAAAISTLAGVGPLPVIAGAGAVAGFGEWGKRCNRGILAATLLSAIAIVALGSQFLPAIAPAESGGLFLYFLRTGSVIYGGGFVLIAFLQRDLVTTFHWLTSKQLLDAVAVGQITPGPVFTTATFIGYILNGVPGALMATLGIFLPSFFFCAISGPFIPVLRKSAVAGAFLNGVNAAAVAIMAVVTWDLARAALVDPLTVGIAAAAAILLALTSR